LLLTGRDEDDPRSEFLYLEMALPDLLKNSVAYKVLDARIRELRKSIDPSWIAMVGREYRIDLWDFLPDARDVVVKNLEKVTRWDREECEKAIGEVPFTLARRLDWAEAERIERELCTGPDGEQVATVEILIDPPRDGDEA
jgi:hypothetical protein